MGEPGAALERIRQALRQKRQAAAAARATMEATSAKNMAHPRGRPLPPRPKPTPSPAPVPPHRRSIVEVGYHADLLALIQKADPDRSKSPFFQTLLTMTHMQKWEQSKTDPLQRKNITGLFRRFLEIVQKEMPLLAAERRNQEWAQLQDVMQSEAKLKEAFRFVKRWIRQHDAELLRGLM